MLKQEQQEPENKMAAAKARVTAQELAEAVAALETRQEAERQKQAETIPITDAVQHLGLDASEEELLAEVEAGRRRRERKAQQDALNKATNKIFREVACGTAGTIAFVLVAALALNNFALRHRLQEVTQSFTPLPVQPLSQVPDNAVVHVDDLSLKALASGLTAWDKVSVDTRRGIEEQTDSKSGQFNNEWALVKSEAALSVRAWATADEALRAGNRHAAAIYSNLPAWRPAANVVPVELPAFRFAYASMTGFNAKGESANGVNNVLEAVSLPAASEAVRSIVTDWLTAKLPSGALRYNANNGYSYDDEITMDEACETVTIEGQTEDFASYQRITKLIEEVLQKMNIHAKVVNKLTYEKV